MRRPLTALLLAASLCMATAATAEAGGLYYPKRAYFRMTVEGTQTTTVRATTTCTDADQNEVVRTGELSETVRFSTRRPGIVLFKTDGHGGVDLFQQSADFEDGVRPVLARGSLARESNLSRNGRSAMPCEGVDPALGCGTESFESWRLFLFGRGRGVKVGLGTSGVPGGDPLRSCTHSSLFPQTFTNRPVRVARGVPFRRRTLRMSAQQSQTTRFDYAYERTTGEVTRTIEWKARFERKGPVTRGGQPIR